MLGLSLLIIATPADRTFPERGPGLMEACLDAAVAGDLVTETADSYKYICPGPSAQALWDWLEAVKLPSFEQDVPEGRWLSRTFPLGGCFKRVRGPDGAPPQPGLSCTIWVPKPKSRAASAE